MPLQREGYKEEIKAPPGNEARVRANSLCHCREKDTRKRQRPPGNEARVRANSLCLCHYRERDTRKR